MGWWSTDALGGDHPLDVIAGIEDILDAGSLYPPSAIASPGLVRSRLEERLDSVLALAGEPGTDDYDRIAWQVVGVVAVSVGADLPVTVTQRVLDAIDRDEWALRDPGRAEAMGELYLQVRTLTAGIAAPVATTGLLVAVEQMHVSGQAGPVNLAGPSRS